ncbi:hypothetical protein D3C86_1099080 [compost metagenome]
MTPTIKTRDTWVKTPQGTLFARIWNRDGEDADLREEAPIVLFHDSLGCVQLWCSFPENLCIATARSVVAYDRLGFGKSAPFREVWTADFIYEEAKTIFPVLRETVGLVMLGQLVLYWIAIPSRPIPRHPP